MKKIITLIFALFSAFIIANGQNNITITGNVTSSEDNLGVIGAAVYIKGTTIGTTSDLDGNYKLTVPEGTKTLVFSYVGLATQEIAIEGLTEVNVVLKPDVFKMDEVVVAGVASATPKRKLSVSVAKVGSEELQNVPASSASTALQGKVAGITVVGSGSPGQGASIRLRSSTSIYGSQSPLIIVDGVMIDGSLADINADDIESIEVVKGAAASALYGSRAGSGVISIKTKRGSSAAEGTTEIKFRNEFGFSQLARKIKLAEHHPFLVGADYNQGTYTKYDSVTYPAGYVQGYDNRIKGSRMLDYDHYADNPYAFVKDPQDEMFQNGLFYTNYLSIASNSNKTGILISFENNKNSGIVFHKKGQSRQNVRINVDHKLNDIFKISASSLFTQNEIDMSTTSAYTLGAFSDVLFMNPDVNVNMDAPASDTTILKKYYIKPDNWAIAGNPKHTLYYEEVTEKRNGMLLNLNGSANLLSWLVFDAEYSLEKRFTFLIYSRFIPIGFLGSDKENEKNGSITKNTISQTSQSAQATLNFNKKFNELVLKGKVSYLFEKQQQEYFYGAGDSLLANGVKSLSALGKGIVVGSEAIDIRARDYFGILDLDYKDRYIASILYRYDGSSLFGDENKWNPYYRVSLAYRISEDFKIPNVQELKLRYSIGTSGQRPGYSYQYETYDIENGQYVPYSAANKAIKPSETRESEFGFNMQFFERFEADFTYSFNKTSDVILPVPQGAASGFKIRWQNAATLEGNSMEFTLSTQAIKTKDFEWRLSLSYDKMNQKITDLYGSTPNFFTGPDASFQYFYNREGENFGVMYGYEWVKSLEQMKYQLKADDNINNYTVNSDGYVIKKGTEGTVNEKPIALKDASGSEAFVKIADMNADFNMSLNSTFSYKKFSLSMLWSLKQGGDIYNYTKQNLFLDKRAGDYDQTSKSEYQKKAIDYYNTFYDGFKANSYFVEDGSYIKLRELSLYYNVGNIKISGKTIFKGVKIGVLGRNLFTFTNYSGWDPEVSSGADRTNYIVDMFNYPNFRTYTASLELTF